MTWPFWSRDQNVCDFSQEDINTFTFMYQQAAQWLSLKQLD